ncbi:MAG: cobalamin biosynthesis protein CobD, partial [Clostridia bacterium]|nr:cobalamin biosynthesis protein CobD [Clostridia bacterium]
MAPDLVAAAAAAGLVLDAGLGEPPAAIHPVVWMGRLATVLEGVARRRALGPQAERLAGAAVALGVVGVATGMAMAALRLAGAVSPMLELVVGAWLVFTSVAWRGLRQAVGDVAAALRRQDLPAARHLLQRVVGRETARLPAWEVARAAVESVAENTVDAVVAPFFYALLAGPAGAVAYRAVNTLDAMFGYRDDRYRYFGWASARLDDLANYLPARLAALLFPLAAAAAGRSAGAPWRARRPGRRRP